MRRPTKQRFAASDEWYESAAGGEPKKDAQLLVGLGIDNIRLEEIKYGFEKLIQDDDLLSASFRDRSGLSLRDKTIRKVMGQIPECKSAPAPWIYKAMQSILGRVHANMRKKRKMCVRYATSANVGSASGHGTQPSVSASPVQPLPCPYSLEQIAILLCRRQQDGANAVLYMDVASILVAADAVSDGIRSVQFERLVEMCLKAGVDCEKEWIWASHLDAMPIRNDGALRAALSHAIHGGMGQVVFTAIEKDSMHSYSPLYVILLLIVS